MSKVTLTKWGNSIGVRIPHSILKESHLKTGEELEIRVNKKGGLSLIPISNPQKGWTEAFNAIADAQNDDLLLDISNEFDQDDWKW